MNYRKYIRSHNLLNRVYDMLDYYDFFPIYVDKEEIKYFLGKNLKDIAYVETLANYFEKKYYNKEKNLETKMNLKDLIYDLNYLKQYLE